MEFKLYQVVLQPVENRLISRMQKMITDFRWYFLKLKLKNRIKAGLSSDLILELSNLRFLAIKLSNLFWSICSKFMCHNREKPMHPIPNYFRL